ncbi:MAG: hypothetical protein JWN86_3044 [Planctomycetota bacterium]|nr:hypothetical protein [Planctomycetota bacterium]
MKRGYQSILIGSAFLASWLGMQATHECGHVLGAWLTGGQVARVVLHPLTISRTDLAENPHPLLVAWSGACGGIVFPCVLYWFARRLRASFAFVIRFFAGSCLIANGAYLSIGSISQVGDAGDLIRLGYPAWVLWIFGAISVPTGIGIWHGQGQHFGLGVANGHVRSEVAFASMVTALLLVLLGYLVGGE